MKNHIVVSEDVLQHLDDDWNAGSYTGYELLKVCTNVFEMDKDKILNLQNESLKLLIQSMASSGRVCSSENTFSDCCHHVVCEYDEQIFLKEKTIYLNPTSLLENKIVALFLSGSFVVPNSEFNDDAEIWKLVEKLYSFCSAKDICLIARYFNSSCGVLSIARKYSSPLTICTVVNRYSTFQYYNVIDSAYGSRGYQVKSTCKSDEIHQREIVLREIVINFDTDFSDAKVSNKTWQMSVVMSDLAYAQKKAFMGKLKRETRSRR